MLLVNVNELYENIKSVVDVTCLSESSRLEMFSQSQQNFYPCSKPYQVCSCQWDVSRSCKPGPGDVSPACDSRSLWRRPGLSGSAVFCSGKGCGVRWHAAPAGGCLGNLEGSSVPRDCLWNARSDMREERRVQDQEHISFTVMSNERAWAQSSSNLRHDYTLLLTSYKFVSDLEKETATTE